MPAGLAETPRSFRRFKPLGAPLAEHPDRGVPVDQLSALGLRKTGGNMRGNRLALFEHPFFKIKLLANDLECLGEDLAGILIRTRSDREVQHALLFGVQLDCHGAYLYRVALRSVLGCLQYPGSSATRIGQRRDVDVCVGGESEREEISMSVSGLRGLFRARYDGRVAADSHAHRLLDQLGTEQLAAVVRLLETMVPPEENRDTLSNAERRAVAEADEWLRHNQPIPHEQVLAELGLTMADWEKMAEEPRTEETPRTSG